MRYDAVHAWLIHKLETELPLHFTYHNVGHTLNVIDSAQEIAALEGISGDELTLLKTAALFHDSGFLEGADSHELRSCEIARGILPEYGYSPAQIDIVCATIMATRLPQSPVNHLGEILADADLYYLGGKHYEKYAAMLFAEYLQLKTVTSQGDWLKMQVDFLSAHRYFTASARKNREQTKIRNLHRVTHKMTTAQHKPSAKEVIKDGFFLLLGVLIAGLALKFFLVPNHFFDGGVTGISLLIHEITHINLAAIIIPLNIPFVIVSYFSVSRSFAIRTFIAVLLLGLCLVLLPDYALTSDKLLISIFGGVFLGIGIGLIMRSGAALDGIEVLALYTLKKTSFTITEIILGINVVIFTIAAFTFGIETALYSILTYFAATRTIDYVVEGLQAHTGVTIISAKSEEIKFQLVNNLGRGITVYKGERGFLPGSFEKSEDCDIIFTVVTRLEIRKLNNLIHDVDPKAFVFANTIREASGGILTRRSHH